MNSRVSLFLFLFPYLATKAALDTDILWPYLVAEIANVFTTLVIAGSGCIGQTVIFFVHHVIVVIRRVTSMLLLLLLLFAARMIPVTVVSREGSGGCSGCSGCRGNAFCVVVIVAVVMVVVVFVLFVVVVHDSDYGG